jgi:hypothetical protein
LGEFSPFGRFVGPLFKKLQEQRKLFGYFFQGTRVVLSWKLPLSRLYVLLFLIFKEFARGGERTRVLSISFIFSFSQLYR